VIKSEAKGPLDLLPEGAASIAGVEGVYDRHSYVTEKAHALNALAGLIENILAPTDSKVRRLRG
jgi:hypothetical protein